MWNDHVATYKKDKGQQKLVVLTPEQIAEVVCIYQTWQAEGTDGTAFAKPELYRSVLRDVSKLLYRSGYPPEWDEEVFRKVLEQVENFKTYEGEWKTRICVCAKIVVPL